MTWLLDHVLERLVTTDFSLKPVSRSRSKRLETFAAVAANIARVNPLQPETFLIQPAPHESGA